MTNIYNKKCPGPNGTLIDNWYEERCLRDKTNEGRTVGGKHIPKRRIDDKNIKILAMPEKDDTFERILGDKPYKEFKTTNNDYGEYFTPTVKEEKKKEVKQSPIRKPKKEFKTTYSEYGDYFAEKQKEKEF